MPAPPWPISQAAAGCRPPGLQLSLPAWSSTGEPSQPCTQSPSEGAASQGSEPGAFPGLILACTATPQPLSLEWAMGSLGMVSDTALGTLLPFPTGLRLGQNCPTRTAFMEATGIAPICPQGVVAENTYASEGSDRGIGGWGLLGRLSSADECLSSLCGSSHLSP